MFVISYMGSAKWCYRCCKSVIDAKKHDSIASWPDALVKQLIQCVNVASILGYTK